MTTELKMAVAEYLANMATEMAQLAAQNELPTTAYLLDMAAADAGDNAKPQCRSDEYRGAA